MRAASGMSRTIDRRRPWKLSQSQKTEVNRHPEVRLVRRRQERLREVIKNKYGTITRLKGSIIYDQYQKALRSYRNMKRRQEDRLLQEIKTKFKIEQPVADIERQLEGLPVAEEPEGTQSHVFPERVRVIDTLFTFATDTTEQEYERRSAAINALVALCSLQGAHRLYRQKTGQPYQEPLPQQFPSLSDSLGIECKPTQCIFCLGREEIPSEKRLKCFHSRGDLKKHIFRHHFSHHQSGVPIDCPHPRCKISLSTTSHLQNHAEMVHKTPT